MMTFLIAGKISEKNTELSSTVKGVAMQWDNHDGCVAKIQHENVVNDMQREINRLVKEIQIRDDQISTFTRRGSAPIGLPKPGRSVSDTEKYSDLTARLTRLENWKHNFVDLYGFTASDIGS